MQIERFKITRDNTPPTIFSALTVILLTMVISTGFSLMLLTSFRLEYKISTLLFWTGITAAVLTAVHVFNKKTLSLVFLVLPALTPALFMCFDIFKMRQNLFGFLNYIQINIIYSMPGDFSSSESSSDLLLPFLMLYNLLPVSVTVYTLIKRRFIPLALLPYLPLFMLSVANIAMIPSTASVVCASTGVILLMLANSLRNKKRNRAEKIITALLLPSLLTAFIPGLVFPHKNYTRDKLASDFLSAVEETLDSISGQDEDSLLKMIVRIAHYGILDREALRESISSNQFTALYASDKDLTKVGPFNPEPGRICEVTKKINWYYDGSFELYEGSALYLKVETLDTYADNTLTRSRIPREVYKSDVEFPEYPGHYSISVNPLLPSSVDITPYYTDHYVTRDASSVMVGAYNTTHEECEFFASAPIPVKTGNIYSEQYIEDYVYGTALAVPERTRDALTMSGMLPDWYMECLSGDSTMSDADKVRAVTEFVSSLHPYNKYTVYPPDDVDFVPWFVTKGETGICVHYATTAVVLLRMIGIPARYVTGFTTNRAYQNTTSVIYSEDAHAWFEFFVPEYGWIMGDPTPGMSFTASRFDINAVAEAYPEIETAFFSRNRYGSAVITPAPTEETTGTIETTETTAATTETTEPLPSESGTAPSGLTADPTSAMPSGETDIQDSGTKIDLTPLFNTLRIIGKVLLAVFIAALAVFLARTAYVSYWRYRFSTKTAGAKIVAYSHYYGFINRFLGKPLPSQAVAVIDKVAFSREKITKSDLNRFIRACKKSTSMLKRRLPDYKKILFRLLELDIRTYI